MSGKNFLKINDLVTFSIADQDLVKAKDDYEGAFKPSTPGQTHPSGLGTMPGTTAVAQQSAASGFLVRIAATHAGIITRNNGFYIPDKMKKGASSFTDNYRKPVLMHHQEHQDPIGRIVESAYIDTSGLVQDKYNIKNGVIVKDRSGKEKGVLSEALFHDFVSGRLPFGGQVDVICSLLRDSLLDDDLYDGLGHIEIVANITDKAAMEKLLDGRYLTGSVGATTDKAVCSICKQDWTDEGRCDHRPGAVYDGAKCFIIAGNLIYDEYSFVNVPADRHSKVLELNYNGVNDSIENANDFNGRIYEVRLGFPQYDSVTKEEMVMSEKKTEPVKAPVEQKDQVLPAPESTTEKKTEESKPADPVVEPAKVEPTVADKTTTEPKKEEVTTPVEPKTETVVEDASCGKKKKKKMKDDQFEEFMTKVLGSKELSQEDQDTLYDLMWEQIEEAVAEGELKDIKEEDAKLSSEKRKKLAKSTFCGPGRSFPVPDCAHVTAARRLIGRYKGEGDKSKILACVSRKAKALGCDTSKDTVKKDSAPVTTEEKKGEPAVEVKENIQHARILRILLAALEEDKFYNNQEPVLNDDEAKQLQTILKRMAGMVGQDAFGKALGAENLAMSLECEKALLDEVVKAETEVGNLREEVEALRKEYTNLFKDMEALQDTLVDAKAASRKVAEEYVGTLMTLKDGKVDKEALAKLSDEVLVSEQERLVKTVDMAKIVDKLGDGMSREPTVPVDDPTVVRDNKQEDQKRQMSPTELGKIQEEIYSVLFSRGQTAAEAYIKRLQMEGKLPQETETK